MCMYVYMTIKQVQCTCMYFQLMCTHLAACSIIRYGDVSCLSLYV